MARVTHVKKAQQRYHTKPVIDPATGEQKKTPVLRRDGSQKTTKGGRPVFLRVTVRDLERPKPLFKCDAPGCGEVIQLGTPYKWVQPHGQAQRNRHAGCPSWQPWELSNSLSARVARIQADDPDRAEFDDADSIKSWLEEKASEVRELAEEKRESSNNIIDGFGHDTEQSQELADIADQLDGWADEMEQVEIPELPEPEEEDCEECQGSGLVEGDEPDVPDTCDHCGGSGQDTPDDPSDGQMEEWREAAVAAAREALDNCPV